MHFQKNMVWLTIASSIVCMLAFHFLKVISDDSERPLALFLSWFFYYGIFAMLGPLLLTSKQKAQMFAPAFLSGTILLIFWNVFLPMLAIAVA